MDAPSPNSTRAALRRVLIFVAALTLLLGMAWWEMIKDGGGKALHSYTVAIPFICFWLIRQERPDKYPGLAQPSRVLGGILVALGLGLALAGFLARREGAITSEVSWLTTQIGGWVLGVWGGVLALAGAPWFRRHAFPLGFLVFTIPIPQPVVDQIETGLQYASASVVEWVFMAIGQTYLRDARSFWLPGLRFVVAPECSGIRSTIVLFITSLLAGYLLLRSPWRRAILAGAIIPLGIARNTFRICTLTLMTVHVDPRVIESWLHSRGGPIFFGLSLIPLFGLLWWLRRRESGSPSGPGSMPPPPGAPLSSGPATPGLPTANPTGR